MPSQAKQDFDVRLEDVQQLIDAHDALTRLRRAEASLQEGGRELENIAAVIQHLVTDPGAGRRREVHALNNAGIALLSGHLQGFVVDIYKESAAALLVDHVQSVNAVVQAAYTRGNPNSHNIINLFRTLGFEDVLDGISWQGMSTASLRKKLDELNKSRNKIVHGAVERTRKQILMIYLSVFRNFSDRLDRKLRTEIRRVSGRNPW